MNITQIQSIYFIGAGGIGMSALIRYFLFNGIPVAGYDRTPSPLTDRLISEGAAIHYTDNVELIPEQFRLPDQTVVVYTPAVPESHTELTFFQTNGFEVLKRSQMLGNHHPIETGTLHCRHAWQDDHFIHDSPFTETVARRLQRISGRHPEKLRQQPDGIRTERPDRSRG